MPFIFRVMQGRPSADEDTARAPADRQKALQELDRLRARELVLPEWMRSTPAWDILLHLFVNPADWNGRPLRDLVRSAGLTEDIGRHWVSALAEERLVDLNETPFGPAVVLKVATKCNIQFYLDYVESAMSSRRRQWNEARKKT